MANEQTKKPVRSRQESPTGEKNHPEKRQTQPRTGAPRQTERQEARPRTDRERTNSSAARRAAAPAKRPAVPEKRGAAPEKRPAASEKRAASPEKRPAGTGKRTAPPEKRPASGREPGQTRRPASGERETHSRTARRDTGDAGYQPYKAANDRKKRNRSNSVRRFFSRENGVIKSVTGYFDRVRERDAMRKMTRNYQVNKNSDAPAVIYTQPRAFSRDKLLVQLMTVLAVVAALILGLSVFFKVKVITVSGAEVYGAWTVREASGIAEGDNLLTFSRAKAAGKITAKLPYVKSARIGIKLPDTVNIEIVEEDVVYAIQSSDGVWWLMNSSGKVVEQTTNSAAKTYTQVLGVTLEQPVPGEMGVATEEVSTQTDESGETVQLTLTGAQQLSAALEILQALEDNDIVGQAASVNVTRLNDIILWYGTQYQVNLGENVNIPYKIACMNDVILQLSDYQTGILDVSFTNWKEQVGFTPFD